MVFTISLLERRRSDIFGIWSVAGNPKLFVGTHFFLKRGLAPQNGGKHPPFEEKGVPANILIRKILTKILEILTCQYQQNTITQHTASMATITLVIQLNRLTKMAKGVD